VQTGCLWMMAFTADLSPMNVTTMLSLYDDIDGLFSVGRLHANVDGYPIKGVRDCRAWLEESLIEMAGRPSGNWGHVTLGRGTDEKLLTYFESRAMGMCDKADNEPDPCLILHVDFELSRFPNSARVFVEKASRTLIRDKRVWYGFIDVAPVGLIPHVAYYRSTLNSRLSWDQFVEHEFWRRHGLRSREKVRRVFWGNIFGPDLARRMNEAGYEKTMSEIREETPGSPEPVTLLEDTGSMAVFLDNDPVGFARNRLSGFHSLSPAVKTGGALWAVLSKAGLL